MLDPDGGVALVLSRGVAVAFLLSVLGTLVFRAVVLPHVFAGMRAELRDVTERRLGLWLSLNVGGAVTGLCAWLAVVTANLAAPASLADWPSDLWAVLSDTGFGQVLLAQMGLTVATGLVLAGHPGQWRRRIGLLTGTAAAIAEVGHGHAYAMAKTVSLLELSEVAHLWAGGAWLGGLVPLLLVVQLAPPPLAAMAARWFTPLGRLCLVLLAASALLQGCVLVGSLGALVATGYGRIALLKLALFGVLFGFALVNRYRLAPALRGHHAARARRHFIASLVLQTGFGLLIVLAAAWLGQLRPGMDMGMPG